MSSSKVTKRKNKEAQNPQDSKNNSNESTTQNIKYGPMPRFPGQRVWSRGILILGVLLYVWYTSKDTKETLLAKQNEIHQRRSQNIECSTDFLEEIRQYPGCVPKKCGRFVSDKVITSNEADALLRLAQRGLALGGSDGGASILDLHSGALSYKDKFINIYSVETKKKFITATDISIYKIARSKIQHAIAEQFNIDENSLYLTHPTFFSRLTNVEPKTPHDEYWHTHIDKVTYESFHYTSLIYLNDYGVDFTGGRFNFIDNVSNKTIIVEPRKGRLSAFTSGAENPHFVERVKTGTRYAITVSFTCDKTKSINDPIVNELLAYL